MREFKKHRGRTGELLNLGLRALGVLALFGVTALAVHATWDMYGKLTEATQGEEAVQTQLAGLEQQQAQVSASVAEISSPRGVEAQLRERFGVALPGEGEIDIIRPAASAPAQPVSHEGWWARLWHTLFVW